MKKKNKNKKNKQGFPKFVKIQVILNLFVVAVAH